jgi:putative flippase GtrA
MQDHTFFKFLVVGIINTAIGAGIMFTLYNFAGFGYWSSSALNYLIGGISSFFLNKYFTFQVKGWSVFMCITFILTVVLSYLLAYGIAKPVISLILCNSGEKLRGNIALFTGIFLYTILNYCGQRIFVFRRKK